MKDNVQPTRTPKVSLNLDLRYVIVVLCLVIAGMLAAWRPWQAAASDRTIQVTGSASIKATPDSFIFNPNYDFTNTDKAAALSAASSKQTEITAGLKKLGLTDKDIKTSVNGYQDKSLENGNPSGPYIYNLSFNVTTESLESAQKVQDYLTTTSPTGSVSPSTSFSDKKRRELEVQGRNEATKEARSKAEQSAKNLGFKITKVKSVTDGTGFGDPIVYGPAELSIAPAPAGAAPDSRAAISAVQPGENELRYSVSVTYFVK